MIFPSSETDFSEIGDSMPDNEGYSYKELYSLDGFSFIDSLPSEDESSPITLTSRRSRINLNLFPSKSHT